VNRLLSCSCRIHSLASPVESVTVWVQVSDELYPNVSGGTALVLQCSCAVDTDLSLSLRSDCGLKVTGVCMKVHKQKRWWPLWLMVLCIRPWRTSFETRNKQLRNNLLEAKSLSSFKYLSICENRVFVAVVTKDSLNVFVQNLMNSAQSFSPSFFRIYFNHLITPVFLLISSI
jgi:hypothetical protein